jgi:hypothetical protein
VGYRHFAATAQITLRSVNMCLFVCLSSGHFGCFRGLWTVVIATAVKAMCQYCSTVTVCDCHYISAHCYQYVRQPQLLKPCASTAVQLLYAIVTISVHIVTNMYGSHSC